MRILAIDTGGDSCAVALYADGKAIAETIIPTQRDQAKILAPLTAELLSTNTLTTQAIDRFAIATGPGSFTGLRVGLAFVRGLALANAKPAFGFDHFQITAHAIQTFYPQTKPVLIIRESKRADLFCAWLNADHTIENYFLSTAQDILEKLPADCLITGNGAAPLLALNPSLHMLDISDTRFMQSLAQLTQRADPAQHSSPQPLYLREADVTAPKPLAHTA